MKKIFFFLLLPAPFQFSLFAQCGTCPSGAINTLPASHTIAAGTTYCISGTINDVTDYTINGTLVIQSGSVTLGNLTVSKAGSVVVNPGSRLMANSYTGETTAPASGISNVTICSYGYLYLSGAINPGETNFTVSDYGAFVIHGSWSTIISDTYFKLGMGSVVEMCSPFMFKSGSGFFTETSTGASYVVTRSSMANGAGGGYLSRSGDASQINWDIPGGPVAWVTHPISNTCIGPSCTLLLPPGSVDDGVCGSVATGYPFIIVPLRFLSVEKKLSGRNLLITTELGDALQEERLVLENAEDAVHFTPTVFEAVACANNRYQFTLPAIAAGNYYRIRATANNVSIFSNVLPPSENTRSSPIQQTYAFPNPATNFVYVSIAPNEKVTSAVVSNCIGQIVQNIPVTAKAQLVRCDLPASLPAGIYFIRLMGMPGTLLTVRVVKTL